MKRRDKQKRAVQLEQMIETAGHVQLGEKTSWDAPKPRKAKKPSKGRIRSETLRGQAKNEYVRPGKQASHGRR